MANAALRIERLVAIVFAICLIGACAVHIADLLRHGWLPYRFAPRPLNVYWTSLTFFNGLAAFLLLCSMRIGLFLTLVIIASDVAFNLFARFGLGLSAVNRSPIVASFFEAHCRQLSTPQIVYSFTRTPRSSFSRHSSQTRGAAHQMQV
jgi:hypothetical protein